MRCPATVKSQDRSIVRKIFEMFASPQVQPSICLGLDLSASIEQPIAVYILAPENGGQQIEQVVPCQLALDLALYPLCDGPVQDAIIIGDAGFTGRGQVHRLTGGRP